MDPSFNSDRKEQENIKKENQAAFTGNIILVGLVFVASFIPVPPGSYLVYTFGSFFAALVSVLEMSILHDKPTKRVICAILLLVSIGLVLTNGFKLFTR
jgi:hypothetical protein